VCLFLCVFVSLFVVGDIVKSYMLFITSVVSKGHSPCRPEFLSHFYHKTARTAEETREQEGRKLLSRKDEPIWV